MKITAIFGSPVSKGNTETMAEAFLAECAAAGADITRWRLNELDYKGCSGCMGCKTGHEECVLRDGLTPVLRGLHSADVVVIATPVYFFDVTSQLKGFIDRGFSFLTPQWYKKKDMGRLKPGKELVFVVAQSGAERVFHDMLQRYSAIFTAFGFKPLHLVRGGRLRGPSDIASRPELLVLAREKARLVIAGAPSGDRIPEYNLD
ncbi:MAG: flavodoxin family protein [Elusimicrobiota bacterium]|nr:flavodoxin family protein [Elusimicrobiota bacterium]